MLCFLHNLCDWTFKGKNNYWKLFFKGFQLHQRLKIMIGLNFWCSAVIANGLWKQLCLRKFPQLSRVDRVIESVDRVIESNSGSGKESVEVGSSYQMERKSLEREDRVYALLAQYCTSSLFGNCISEAIRASSTDNYPEESIKNTLQADIVEQRASYWSSKGQSNPAVPETLTYKLASELCVVTEINIRPFQGVVSKFLQTMCSSSLFWPFTHLLMMMWYLYLSSLLSIGFTYIFGQICAISNGSSQKPCRCREWSPWWQVHMDLLFTRISYGSGVF